MMSRDLVKWDVIADLYDFRDRSHLEAGVQYVQFEFEGDDIIYVCKTALNKATPITIPIISLSTESRISGNWLQINSKRQRVSLPLLLWRNFALLFTFFAYCNTIKVTKWIRIMLMENQRELVLITAVSA